MASAAKKPRGVRAVLSIKEKVEILKLLDSISIILFHFSIHKINSCGQRCLDNGGSTE